MSTFQKKDDSLKCLALGFAACLLVHVLCATATAQDRPNIIIIMADDMGYSDIGCFGGEIETPNLDQLAAGGLRYTRFYNAARCCPTRAALLTGLYPHQTDLGWMTASDFGRPGYRGQISKNCVTIAEALKPAGYRTYMTGKWHVAYIRTNTAKGPKDNWPRQRGFDRFFGTLRGAGSFFKPNSLTDDNTIIEPPDEFYYTDAISDHAATFIRDHKTDHADKPFFMYVPYTAPHWPMHAKPQDIAKYEGRYLDGWDVLRAERHKRMIQLGVVDARWPMSPLDELVEPWDADMPEQHKKVWAKRMAIYAAMIDCMDQGIGRIVGALKDSGQYDNTLILFLADNGGCHENIDDMPGHVGDLERMGTAESNTSYLRSWANASNTPFREFKTWTREGGISTPLIAHWPARIEPRAEPVTTLSHVIDLMATCIDLSGVEYPTQYNGHKIKPLAGKSLVPTFTGGDVEREALYWEHESNRAVRMGKWKLVARDGEAWALHDMDADRTELHNLADEHPELVEQMAAMWQAWAERSNVLPLVPGGRYGVRMEMDVNGGAYQEENEH